MKAILFFLLVVSSPFLLQAYLSNLRSGQEIKSYTEKILKAGFDFEEHKIITKDGYILTTWRIPRKTGDFKAVKKQPVILQHGLLDDSWTFFVLKSSDCLPFMLVLDGYDVWLPNSRGTIFSTDHLNPAYNSNHMYSPYWNFTFSDMAEFDLPANIDYIKKVTGYEKINYLGHSQGNFIFFLSYLSNPKYIESSINRFVAVGTVVTIFNIVYTN